jgi:nicotinate (nicotinamide) nucleotide adenylyltransferase
MLIKTLQKKVEVVFKQNFGYTPLTERLKDIQNEFFELMKWQDVKNLKEETGDLLSSLLQLCNENDWDSGELVENTLKKIESRKLQYLSLGRKTKVALYGGAFNPITNGHIQAAQFILNTSGEFDEVWLVPAYQHMNNKVMASAEHRLAMCKLAAKADSRIKVFDYEIANKLSGESYYLIKKLKLEEELNAKYNFSLVIGLDNANSFDTWVNYQELERMVRMVVVPRKGYEPLNNAWYFKALHIYLNGETNIMEVSSTEVRDTLHTYSTLNYRTKEDMLRMIDSNVYDYIAEHKLYI